MRVLLLLSTLGSGHKKAADAIAEALRERRPDSVVQSVDFWSLFDPQVAGALQEGYLDVVTGQPRLYDRLYHFDAAQWRAFFRNPDISDALDAVFERGLQRWFPQRGRFPARGANLEQTLLLQIVATLRRNTVIGGNLVRRSLILWLHRLLMKRLKQRILDFSPDVVISTQMHPTSLLSALRRNGEMNDIPAVAVLTDYGVHEFWVRADMDHYCVATQGMADTLRASGVTRASIAVTGIPLLQDFRQPLESAEARHRLGLDAARPTLLITGGGYGIGALETLEPILRAGLDHQILVAAGGRQELDPRLTRRVAGHDHQVHLYHEQVDMPLLVAAADVVIGKPGGLSVSEAVACGRPFLAVCSLGGQEGFNVAYLEHHDIGGAVDPSTLVERLREWRAQPVLLEQVQARARSLGCRNGALAVVDSVLNEHGVRRFDQPGLRP